MSKGTNNIPLLVMNEAACVSNLITARYLLVYKHCSTNSGVLTASGTLHPLRAFINNNKMLLIHLTYIAMLALIGNTHLLTLL